MSNYSNYVNTNLGIMDKSSRQLLAPLVQIVLSKAQRTSEEDHK